MAQTLNITNRYNNQDKRYADSVVMTLPSKLEEGGVRLSTPEVYMQFGDAYTAAIVEKDTIVKEAFLIIDEPFPAGTLLAVDIAGTQFFNGVDATVKGLTVSLEFDQYFENGQTITVAPTGGTGDVTTGLARVVLDTVSNSISNGNYAAS